MRNKVYFKVINFKTFRLLPAIIAIVALLLLNAFIFLNLASRLSSANPLGGNIILVDAGHGGIDGGAGSGTGVLEKEINLSIALKIKEEFARFGTTAILTREKDASLEELTEESGSRHTRDLIARLEMINSGKCDAFVSVHANCVSGNARARGPIVFYSGKLPSNVILAQDIHDSLNESIAEIGGRMGSPTPVKGNYYLISNANIPGVLVETGFLSNGIELGLLKDPGYQQRLAGAIVKGFMDFLSRN